MSIDASMHAPFLIGSKQILPTV